MANRLICKYLVQLSSKTAIENLFAEPFLLYFGVEILEEVFITILSSNLIKSYLSATVVSAGAAASVTSSASSCRPNLLPPLDFFFCNIAKQFPSKSFHLIAVNPVASSSRKGEYFE